MKCYNCPFYRYYESESGTEYQCLLFGEWENEQQREEKGEIVGCTISRAAIEKYIKERKET